MLELYQTENCYYCRIVKARLDELGVEYIVHDEPREHAKREGVFKVSGQRFVPTLVDTDRNVVIANDEVKILEHLERHYGPHTD
jgi:glutathione S-transferase